MRHPIAPPRHDARIVSRRAHPGVALSNVVGVRAARHRNPRDLPCPSPRLLVWCGAHRVYFFFIRPRPSTQAPSTRHRRYPDSPRDQNRRGATESATTLSERLFFTGNSPTAHGCARRCARTRRTPTRTLSRWTAAVAACGSYTPKISRRSPSLIQSLARSFRSLECSRRRRLRTAVGHGMPRFF